MSLLSTVLETFCLQSKEKLDPSKCELHYQKKKLDLGTPVRFANLPKDAKLELVTGEDASSETCLDSAHTVCLTGFADEGLAKS